MKRAFLKLLVLSIIVGSLQIAVTLLFPATFWGIDLLNTYLKEEREIIFLGDSTISPYTVLNEKVTFSTVEMLQSLIPELRIGGIVQASYGLDIYLAYVQYLSQQPRRPRLIIMPVNMRSLSPEMDNRPEFQFVHQKVLLSGSVLARAFYNPLSVFKYHLSEIGQREFENLPVFDGDTIVGKVAEFEATNFRQFSDEGARKLLTLKYMYHLTESSRKIRSLIEIARLAKTSNIKVLFYITPIDYETGEKYLPGKFSQRLKDNVHLVVSLCSRERFPVEDLSRELPSKEFAWYFPFISEHLGQKGASRVAHKIAKAVRSILGNQPARTLTTLPPSSSHID